MKKKLDLKGFQTVFRSFIRNSNLEDKVATNAVAFVDLTKEVHTSLREKGFEFTKDVTQFVNQIGSIQNKTINRLGKSSLRNLSI